MSLNSKCDKCVRKCVNKYVTAYLSFLKMQHSAHKIQANITVVGVLKHLDVSFSAHGLYV